MPRQRRVRGMRRQKTRPAERVKPLESDVPGRIHIPVKNKTAVLASICVNLQACSLSGETTAATALLRGVMRTNCNQLASGSFGLVGKLLRYKTKGLLALAAAAPVRHALNLEILRGELRRVILDNFAGHTMNGIPSADSHSPALHRKRRLLLCTTFGLAPGSRHSPLALLILTVRCFNRRELRPVAQRARRLYAKVDRGYHYCRCQEGARRSQCRGGA